MAAPLSRFAAGFTIALSLIAGPCAAAPAKQSMKLNIRDAQTEALTFASLAGWTADDHAAAFSAFLKSCGAILQGSKAMRAARPVYGGLYNACERAATLAAGGTVDTGTARKFFEDNFNPVRILPPMHTYGYYTGADGFYTGYYEPEVVGSRVKSDEFSIPLYGVPAKLAGKKSRVFSQ